ncbi:MAG TPA: cytochrome c oxidase assembly factor Coa1 family protein [Candidatus Binatia bacterium]|nr:cytochrome c oxidase assembly factor Coa1 family protein [Candidatus Binatia bacterium]
MSYSLVAAFLAGTLLSFVRTANSDAAKLVFVRTQSSPIAIRSLGEPLRRNYFAFGDLETHGSKCEASVFLTVYGPRGRGTLYADAVRFDRSWQLISLDLEVAGPNLKFTAETNRLQQDET